MISLGNRDVLFGHKSMTYPGADIPGQRIRPGQTIGESGSDHLHFGVRKGTIHYNPLFFFVPQLQAQIPPQVRARYPQGYTPEYMYSFDARPELANENFWNDCPDLTDIVLTVLPPWMQ